MTSEVILQKKVPTDTFSYLTLVYFNGNGIRKKVSLGERLELL